jgi:ribosome biogenesis protein MAK21
MEAKPAEAAKPSKGRAKLADLQHDVQALAAQLGLASASGSGGDAAFDDFAPSKAKQSIQRPTKRQKLEDGAAKPEAAAPGGRAKGDGKPPPDSRPAKPEASSKGRHDDNSKAKQPAPGSKADGAGAANDTLKARDWNFGTGPRPGRRIRGQPWNTAP